MPGEGPVAGGRPPPWSGSQIQISPEVARIPGGVGTVVTKVVSLLGSAAVDLVLFAASFRFLTTAQVTTRQVLPGACSRPAAGWGFRRWAAFT
jgi:hypothetical protein